MTTRETVGSQGRNFAIVAPDGGWGWVVVFASFYCQVVLDGILLTFGMILLEMSKYYHVSKTEVSLIGSIMYGTHFMAGPLCAALTHRYGERTISMLGCIVSALGICSTYLHPPFHVLYVTIGIIGGTGLCFVNMNSIVITTLYFTRRRILALGIVVCGTGAGTIIFSIIANIVLKKLDWEYVCLIEGALAFTMVFAVLCFRPLEPSEIQISSDPNSPDIETVLEDDELEFDTNLRNSKYYFLRDNDGHSMRNSLTSRSSDLLDHADELLDKYLTIVANPSEYSTKWNQCCAKIIDLICPCCPEHHRRRAVIKLNPFLLNRMLELTSESESRRTGCLNRCYRSLIDIFSILKSFPFLLFSIAGAILASAMIIIFFFEKVYLYSRATEDEIMLFMINLGTSNMIWRLLLGALPKLLKANYNKINIIGLFIGGTATVCKGLSSALVYSHIINVLSTAATGCFAVFYPVILLDLAGLDKVSSATGISMMFMGVVTIIGAPVTSFIMELTKDATFAFYIAGAGFIVSSLLFMIIHSMVGFHVRHH